MARKQNPVAQRMIESIANIHEGLRIDGRCKHGMLDKQCSFCAGFAPSQYGQSVGLAWIQNPGFTQQSEFYSGFHEE